MRQWLLTAALALALMPAQCWAAGDGFIPLIGIPGVTDQANNTQAFFDAIYGFAIVAAAFLAVVKIMLAGVKYMTTDIADSKAGAKKDIQGALLGLMIVLGAVLILETINPNLTNFTLFKDVPTPIVRPVVVVPDQTDPEKPVLCSAIDMRCRQLCVGNGGEEGTIVNGKIVCTYAPTEPVPAPGTTFVGPACDPNNEAGDQLSGMEICKNKCSTQGLDYQIFSGPSVRCVRK